MKNATKVNPPFALPARVERLGELCYNLWFSWTPAAIDLFKQIDPQAWETVKHNPVRLLREVPEKRLEAIATDEAFLNAYDAVVKSFDYYMKDNTWFKDTYAQHTGNGVVYFSAEFGFHESLPIYSGGLGILAGDHIKAASDLGIPLTGLGLLYKKGYFDQRFDMGGQQHADQITYEFDKLPISPVLDSNGKPLLVSVHIIERDVTLRIWKVQVGRVNVFLLDADHELNAPSDRDLTAQLYGGGQEVRIAQEMLLGIGGIRALRSMKLPIQAYHINEGHAAFITLERMREYMKHGMPFSPAAEMVRSSTIFTTHTPVPAGHDAFPLGMFDYYFKGMYSELGGNRDAIVNLGLNHENNTFNMTHLALNLCGKANGVSKLHGLVSREMFRNFYGPLAVDEVPISSVTNGVHLETWMAAEWKTMLDQYLPAEWTKTQHDLSIWNAVDSIPDEEYWNVHTDLKSKMIDFARQNLKAQARRVGESETHIAEIDNYLSSSALTIGFARRFATYKRATLMFSDLDRLDHLVNNPKQPVQFIFAGKAHPADIPGQQLIKHIHYVSRMERFKGKIVLLENYDMNMARYLVTGVDVWLNNPKRPLEASGTSGQKVALNGGLNFSILDGWWEEGYDGTNGWSIDTPEGVQDGPHLDQVNVHSLYSTMENEIVPMYYTLTKGVAKKWIERSKNSVKTLAPVYNTSRMVSDYTNLFYVPTIERAIRFSADDFDRATKLAYHKQFVRNNWHHVTVMTIEDNNPPRQNEETKKTVKDVFATVFSGWIEPQDTAVEVVFYEDKGSHWEQVVLRMDSPKEVGNHLYRWRTQIPAHLTHGDQFNIRVRPFHEDFSHPHELHLVTQA